jgi:hypothetical protein
MNEEQVFYQALERPASERDAFLDAVCADDPTVRDRVEALLRAHENPGSFLAAPASAFAATDTVTSMSRWKTSRFLPGSTASFQSAWTEAAGSTAPPGQCRISSLSSLSSSIWPITRTERS